MITCEHSPSGVQQNKQIVPPCIVQVSTLWRTVVTAYTWVSNPLSVLGAKSRCRMYNMWLPGIPNYLIRQIGLAAATQGRWLLIVPGIIFEAQHGQRNPRTSFRPRIHGMRDQRVILKDQGVRCYDHTPTALSLISMDDSIRSFRSYTYPEYCTFNTPHAFE